MVRLYCFKQFSEEETIKETVIWGGTFEFEYYRNFLPLSRRFAEDAFTVFAVV